MNRFRTSILMAICLLAGALIGPAIWQAIQTESFAAPVEGAITDEQLDRFIQEELRPFAERMRADKIRIASLRARYAQLTAPPNTTDLISQSRQDASSLLPLTGQNVNDIMYAIGLMGDALNGIPDQTIEPFCVRSIEVAN